jgi:hypothetical protein
MTQSRINQGRGERAATTIGQYGNDSPDSNLIDLLADAMHWCDQSGLDFHIALCQAGRHYVNELNDEQHDERRMS